jgi:class 3 adenylate cyclase/tetratricopeptide (TPR) repeat protein
MTRQLLPQFIQTQHNAGRTQGSLHGYTLFADLSGFTAMTESLMKRGSEGAEILSEILNELFTPMVSAVYQCGGFIPYFAGDAFTAIFEKDTIRESDFMDVAQRLRAFFIHNFKEHDFDINIKIGLSVGDVDWGIVGADHKSFYFRGEAIDACVAAQNEAKKGEIIIHEALHSSLRMYYDTQPHHGHFYFLNANDDIKIQTTVVKEAFISNTFGALFLPEALLEHDQKGEFRNVTTVFISFENINTHAELDAFAGIVLQQMYSFSGYFKEIDYSDKGGVMVGFFGAPVSFENNTARALEFAIALRESLVNQSVKFKIGITSGVAYTGIIGGRERCQYACVGTHVNFAARLMAKAQWGSVLVDEGLSKHKLFRFQSEGELSYKGFQKPIATFRLMGRRLDESPIETGFMVGRARELAELLTFAEPIREGHCAGVASVYGEAGIGKSRLTYELRKALAEQGVNDWLICQSDQILRKPFNPFVYCLKYYFDQSPELSLAENQRNFEQNFQQLFNLCLGSEHPKALDLSRELVRTRSILLALVGITEADSLWDQLDAKGRYDNTKIALSSLFLAEAILEPFVLELEDAHWYDDSSKEFLNEFVKQIADYQIFILVTSRYQDDGSKQDLIQLPEQIKTLELDLNILSADGIKHLAELKLNGEIDNDFSEFLQRTTTGNPFYAEQVLEYFSESNLIESKNGFWALKDKNLRMSNSMNAILMARIDRLSGLVKETVKAAAVIGREFEVPILTEVMRTQEDFIRTNGNMQKVLREQIQEAERSQIWRAMNELRYIFKHSLLREAVYDMQLRTRLRDLHRLIAEAIEGLYADNIEERYADLAFHYEQAAILKKTKEYLHKAGDYAKRNFQNQVALDYYSKLTTDFGAQTSVEEQIKLSLKIGDVHQLIGQWAEAEKAFSEALQKANQLNDNQLLARANNALGLLLMLKGNYNIAEKHFEVALTLFDYLKDQYGISKAYGNLGNLFFRQGKYDEAKTYFTQCIDIAATLDASATNAQIVANLGLTHMNQGEYEAAVQCQLEHLPIVTQRNDKQGIATLHTNLGIVYAEKGDLEAALPHFEQGLAQSRDLGNKLLMSIGIGSIGSVYERLGDYTQARKLYDEDLQITEALGDKQGIAIAHGLMGGLESNVGNFEQATQHLQLNLQLCESLNYKKGIIKATNSLGDVHFLQQDMRTAKQFYTKAIEVSRGINNKQLLCESLVELASTMLYLSDTAAAETLNKEAKYLAKELNHSALLFETLLVSLRIAAQNDSSDQVDVLISALAKSANDDRERAALCYEQYLIAPSETLKSETLIAYQNLYANVPKYLYLKRIEELSF